MCNVKVKKVQNSKILRKHLYFRFQFSQNNEKTKNILWNLEYGKYFDFRFRKNKELKKFFWRQNGKYRFSYIL